MTAFAISFAEMSQTTASQDDQSRCEDDSKYESDNCSFVCLHSEEESFHFFLFHFGIYVGCLGLLFYLYREQVMMCWTRTCKAGLGCVGSEAALHRWCCGWCSCAWIRRFGWDVMNWWLCIWHWRCCNSNNTLIIQEHFYVNCLQGKRQKHYFLLHYDTLCSSITTTPINTL